MWQSIVKVIIETADKIMNKQGKSVMLDFFANCSDLCQLTEQHSFKHLSHR